MDPNLIEKEIATLGWVPHLPQHCAVPNCLDTPRYTALLSFPHECPKGCEFDGKDEYCVVPHLYCVRHQPTLEQVLAEEGWRDLSKNAFRELGRDVPKNIKLKLFHILEDNVNLN